MDFKSPRYSSQLSSLVNGEPPLEIERQSYTKTTTTQKNDNSKNPFAETFPDPLCKLNLKETSEFVKSTFPRREGGTSSVNAAQKRVVVAVVEPGPATPGRPVFRFSQSGPNGLHRKSFPSKWDDAEKWLVNSCHDSPAHHHYNKSSSSNNVGSNNNNNNNNKVVQSFQSSSSDRGFNGVLGSTDSLFLKDKFTDSTTRAQDSEPTKEAFVFKNTRDAGTEMTPMGSSTTSRCQTPVLAISPARHNTPLDRSGPLGPPSDRGAIDVAHFAKLRLYDSAANWSSREEEEEEISKSLRHFDFDFDDNVNTNNGQCDHHIHHSKTNVTMIGNDESRAVFRWEDDEKAKCCSRYQREEAKIQAWVNLQSAKAEAQSRKLEVKVQKMRSNLEEKLMKRMGIVNRKAEEWRETARKQHSEQMQKATQNPHKMLSCNNKNNISMNYHSHFSASCGCFPCNNASTHYI